MEVEMIHIPDNIVVFGTKFEAEQVAYTHVRLGGVIEFVIDNFVEGDFHGISIYKLENVLNIKEYFIIVAVATKSTYDEIKEMLVKRGLNEFQDFVWYNICYKKIVVINANCHGNALQSYLRESKRFNMEYTIYPIEEIQNNKFKEIDEMLLAVTDIYIHQDIRYDNKVGYKLSDEYIIPRLNPLCKEICIPNLVGFGKGIFQTETDEVCTVVGNSKHALFYRDLLIDKAYNEISIKTVDNIIKYISNYHFDETNVKEKFENTLRKLYEREKNWDVKIVGYITEHYQTEKMFHDCNHPSDLLMLKICEKVARLFEINDIDKSKKIQFNLGVEAFIWSGIANILGITRTENEVRQDDKTHILEENALDIREFIREYIWCFHNDCLM